jgi:putative transcriptional regulator
MQNSAYHYIECGLDNIYLLNGFKTIKTPRGQAISIHDLDSLHREIRLHLASLKRPLLPAELSFLRHEMLASEAELAQLLGVSEQTVHLWEQDCQPPTELPVRLIFAGHWMIV